MIEPPYPELDEILEAFGLAGRRLSDIGASEGSAGNISVYMGWEVDPGQKFSLEQVIDLPIQIPNLAGKSFLVTGSGRPLPDIIRDPGANLGLVRVETGGRTGRLFTSPRCLFSHVTSEFNSHLAVHADQVQRSGTNFHAIIHAQPPYLTFLSHVPRYREVAYLNQHLLRWQPELIVQFPEGIGLVPFLVPGSAQLMDATLKALHDHRVVMWAKHGIMARSDISIRHASGHIEYAEAAARYEYLNLASGEIGDGLSAGEVRAICEAFGVQQKIF